MNTNIWGDMRVNWNDIDNIVIKFLLSNPVWSKIHRIVQELLGSWAIDTPEKKSFLRAIANYCQ